MNNINIRLEDPKDYREVEVLVRESFWNVYRPGCLEHYVLKCLRNDPDFVPELDFVLELDGRIIGQNIFVRTVLDCDCVSSSPACCDGAMDSACCDARCKAGTLPIMTMGPICIAPEYKRKGYGKILLDYSLEKARELGCGAVMFEGNIQFYGKSGFTYASDFGIRYHGLPEGADASFFLCKELIPGYLKGISGVYSTPKGYFVCDENPAAFEEYESGFPFKEKLVLPGQLPG